MSIDNDILFYKSLIDNDEALILLASRLKPILKEKALILLDENKKADLVNCSFGLSLGDNFTNVDIKIDNVLILAFKNDDTNNLEDIVCVAGITKDYELILRKAFDFGVVNKAIVYLEYVTDDIMSGIERLKNVK